MERKLSFVEQAMENAKQLNEDKAGDLKKAATDVCKKAYGSNFKSVFVDEDMNLHVQLKKEVDEDELEDTIKVGKDKYFKEDYGDGIIMYARD